MPPVVRASERASQPITRLSSERSTWVCVWSNSCGNIAVNVPQNGAGYTIAFSYTGPVSEESEPTCIDACLRSGAASGRLRDERRTHDPNPDARAARTRHGADRKLDPGAPTFRAATGQHRLRVPGRGRHHAHDCDLLLALGEPADRAGPQRPAGDDPALAFVPRRPLFLRREHQGAAGDPGPADPGADRGQRWRRVFFARLQPASAP